MAEGKQQDPVAQPCGHSSCFGPCMVSGRKPPRDSGNQKELRDQALALPAGFVKVISRCGNSKQETVPVTPEYKQNDKQMADWTKGTSVEGGINSSVSFSRVTVQVTARRSFRRQELLYIRDCTAWGDFPTPLQIGSPRRLRQNRTVEQNNLGWKNSQ